MMMEAGEGVEVFFPVVFFDGERTVDMGCVAINPMMNFKGFRSIISQKIGVSPHQITIYFERTPPFLPSQYPGGGRRFPVTNKFNFAAAIGERNCAYFLVVSKKSRRVRRRRHRQQSIETNDPVTRAATVNYLPEQFTLLRRDPNHAFSNGPNLPYINVFPQIIPAAVENWYPRSKYLDYANKIRSAVEREREKYLMSLNMNSNVYSDLNTLSGFDKNVGEDRGCAGSSEMTSEDGGSSWGGASSTGTAPATCEVCTAARMEGQEASFHCCKLDAVVTEPFRSPAGPIARPSSRLSG